MNTYEAVKLKISKLLDERRMSIYQLSLKASVPPSTIKNILYGKSLNPGVVTLKMLCEGFEITLPDFFKDKIFENLDEEIK